VVDKAGRITALHVAGSKKYFEANLNAFVFMTLNKSFAD